MGGTGKMSVLRYKKNLENDFSDENIYTLHTYPVKTLYRDPNLQKTFLVLKSHVVDLNPALVTKCIQGTEQDFLVLMTKAKDFLVATDDYDAAKSSILMDLFQDCVFGYYFLTPLIVAKEVSDIKVYSWNKIAVKVNGTRYMTDLSFFSEEDYNNWYERLLRIHRLQRLPEFSLQYCTDRKGVDDFYLRIDYALSSITSTEKNIVHIRKMPKTKYSWDYLIENKMLDEEHLEYLKDRVVSGYHFLISGRGGSGKSTLLNNLIDLIPYSESGLIVQESDELYSNLHPQLQFEHILSVEKPDYTKEFSLEDELRLGLLQDIDNFIIGEIKGGEGGT